MRSTKQKDCIHDVFRQTSLALSADELLLECQKTIPNMGIATIHRELKRLREQHQLEEVKIPNDALRFCLANKHHHHHFKCTDCNKVYDIDCGNVDLKLPKGFKKAEHEVNIFGVCDKCT